MGDELTPEERAARRRRLEEVFGTDPYEQTRDDEPEPAPDDAERRAEWLRRQRPPHHG